MKQKNFSKKLNFKKTTVVDLCEKEMKVVKGGFPTWRPDLCPTQISSCCMTTGVLPC